VGLPALRLRGLHLAITSLAFALTVSQFLLNPRYLGDRVTGTLDRPSVFGVTFASDRSVYYLTLAFLLVIVLGVMGMRRSRAARALIAARDNERAAQSFGIDVLKARIVAFGASGLIAGTAGSLLAYQQNGVQASTFNLEAGVNVFQDTVIGGLGTIAGPIIGALYRGLPAILSLPLSVTQATSGALGLLIILAAPGGLGRIVYDVRDALLRRLASRQRIVVPSLVADLGPGDIELAALAPNTEPDGRLAYVPRRYRLTGQWALPATEDRPLTTADSSGS
jgi:branched-chain amino acid transport system permease protein